MRPLGLGGRGRVVLRAMGHVAPHEPSAVGLAHDPSAAQVHPPRVRADGAAQTLSVVVIAWCDRRRARSPNSSGLSSGSGGVGWAVSGRRQRHAVAPAAHQLGRDELCRASSRPGPGRPMRSSKAVTSCSGCGTHRTWRWRPVPAAGRRRSWRRTSSRSHSRAADRRPASPELHVRRLVAEAVGDPRLADPSR